jgi:hypothetical protein
LPCSSQRRYLWHRNVQRRETYIYFVFRFAQWRKRREEKRRERGGGMASPSKTSVAEANKQLSEMFAQMQVRTAFRSLLFFSHAGNHTRTKGREERVLEGSLSLLPSSAVHLAMVLL